MPYAISGQIGADLTDVSSTPKFGKGTIVSLSDGGAAVYVQATSEISTYAAVAINEAGNAVMLTTTVAGAAGLTKRVGASQQSIPSGWYGWVQSGGQFVVNLAANCAPGVPLYTTATAGVLDDAVVSDCLIIGAVATRSISNATAVTCVGGFVPVIGSGDMS